MENTEIMTVEQTGQLSTNVFSDPEAFQNLFNIGKMFASSSLVPQAYQGKPMDCAIACDMANRMNVSPMFVMQNLYVVLERVVLEDNHATVVLGRESDDYSQRVTDLASKLAEASATASEMAETVTATNKTVDGNTTDIQKLAADMDYLAMQMEVTLDE